jgi:sterol desaturase/sphingolipid hydroxylase (fatty acid hydroxylase superfamily)
MEKLTYVHPATPLLLWGSVSAFCFVSGIHSGVVTLKLSIALAATGLFAWTIAEYLLHRYVFHFKPFGPISTRIAFLIHGIHHEDPEDARRLLMPPIAAVILAVILYSFFAAVLGAVNVRPFFSGFLVGYLCYDYTHFAVHFLRPKSKVMQSLKKNHMKHHFVTPDARYGVSNVLWDYVFGSRG